MGEVLTVMILAAVPWVEILFVIPMGLVLGLPPMVVFIAALIGNWLPVALLIAAYGRLEPWLRKRFGRKQDQEITPRQARFRRYWDRYGMPGVAITSPVITGTHLGAVLILFTGADRRRTLAWMTFSLVLWAAGITAAASLGLDLAGLGSR